MEQALARFSTALASCGLAPQQQPARRRGEAGAYSVEFEIDFMRDGNIEDVLEFHVVEGGEPTTELDEMKVWLDEALGDVVAQANVSQ